jgi:hypothetical protein
MTGIAKTPSPSSWLNSPAMEASIAVHVWSIQEIVGLLP